MGAYLVGVAFWVFVAVAAVAGIVGEYQKRRLALEPLRLAIERGQQLDPAIVAQLMEVDKRRDEVKPASLQIGGVMTIAGGVGLALLSFFIAQKNPQALYPIMGAGVLAVCVGIGLLFAAKILAKSQAAEQSNQANG